jgi:DNA mismatch repair ATPase MutL
MKKTFIVSLLAVVSFLSACGTTASKNTEPSTQSTNTAKTSASEKNSSEETSSSTVSEASSSVQSDQNSQTQETVPSTQAPQISSETTAPASSTNTNQDYSIFTPDQAKALQMLLDNKPELNDPDITFAFSAWSVQIIFLKQPVSPSGSKAVQELSAFIASPHKEQPHRQIL